MVEWQTAPAVKYTNIKMLEQRNAPPAKCSISKMLHHQNAPPPKCSATKMLHHQMLHHQNASKGKISYAKTPQTGNASNQNGVNPEMPGRLKILRIENSLGFIWKKEEI